MSESRSSRAAADAVVVLSFEPPDVMLNMNDRMHAVKRSRIVKAWREAAYFYTCKERPGGPAKRALPPGRYRVEAIIPVGGTRRRDPMNWVPTVKAVVDGMNDADLWPDDSAEFVTVAEPVLSSSTKLITIAVVPASMIS